MFDFIWVVGNVEIDGKAAAQEVRWWRHERKQLETASPPNRRGDQVYPLGLQHRNNARTWRPGLCIFAVRLLLLHAETPRRCAGGGTT